MSHRSWTQTRLVCQLLADLTCAAKGKDANELMSFVEKFQKWNVTAIQISKHTQRAICGCVNKYTIICLITTQQDATWPIWQPVRVGMGVGGLAWCRVLSWHGSGSGIGATLSRTAKAWRWRTHRDQSSSHTLCCSSDSFPLSQTPGSPETAALQTMKTHFWFEDAENSIQTHFLFVR